MQPTKRKNTIMKASFRFKFYGLTITHIKVFS